MLARMVREGGMTGEALTRRGRIRGWRSKRGAGDDPRAAAEALFAGGAPPSLTGLAVRLRRERLSASKGAGYSIERHLALARALRSGKQKAPRGSLRGRLPDGRDV